jgi:hypothetical protein
MSTSKDKKEGCANRDGEGSRRSEPPTTNDVMLLMNPEFEVVDFNEFDILLTDIKGETIRKLVVGGCKHHTEVETNNAELPTPASLPGVTYGDYQRVLVKAEVIYRKRLNVIMLVDTGSPYSFLTRETLEALGVKIDDQPSDHVFCRNQRNATKSWRLQGAFQRCGCAGNKFFAVLRPSRQLPFRNGDGRGAAFGA